METQTQHGTVSHVSAGESHVTVDHDIIRGWIEARDGSPALLRQHTSTDEKGMLRVEFSGYSSGEWLESVRWDTFFQHFEDARLAFLYQETMSDGMISRFYQFVSRY